MAKMVLDISKYDEGIDLRPWIESHDLWGVIIKFGGNERVVGGRYTDYVADRHYHHAKELGLHIGAYYYTDVCDTSEAMTDADHFASILSQYEFDLPCYMDVEDSHQFSLSSRELTDVIKSFCDRLNSLGYYAGLYTGGNAWLNNMYSDELTCYANWIAWWKSSWPTEAGDIGMWQQGTMHVNGDIQFDDTGMDGYVDLDWCCIDYPSRISGESKSEEILTPVQPNSESFNDVGFAYRVHCQRAGWMPAVRDGQIAGSTGYSARIEAIKFRPTPEMGSLTAELHIQGTGWVKYEGIKAGDASGVNSSEIDPICGTVGEHKRIEAIKLTLTGNTTGKILKYAGHIQSVGWINAVSEGEVCGTIGESKRLEAIRIWLEDPNNPSDTNTETSNGRASDVINAAYGELGYYAPNDPEPGSKFGRWMAELFGEDWLAGPSNEIWWCCMFVSWCLDQANVKMNGFPTYNTDLALNNGGREYAVDKYDVQYGDIVIFNWDWDGTTDHIGFATGEFDGYGFTTIEGNIGNAVCEQYRQMGNVAYVLRPPYEAYGVVSDQSPAYPTEYKNNRDGGKLDVDGVGGWNTIIDWQNQLNTIEDGTISGQVSSNRKYFDGISNVECDDGGSKFVMTIQSKVGAEVDGYWGKGTSTAIQNWLIDRGYNVGSDGADGYFGRNSVKALQESLNDGAWK